ncbi:MAG: MFS transporter [Bacteroidales bacterium]|nr:MFS transporter [Bacteroidales bacterium]
MSNRTSFPKVFWVANIIEVLERFAYYGIYMGFGIYAVKKLGFSKDEIGNIQSFFLAVSYLIPLFSGTIADKFGFKKVLIVSYLAYIPSILFLLISDTFGEVTMTMLTIAFAAGIFKPLISATVRAVTDSTNKTLGFGIFYAMVNFGASFGPLVAGKLRAISWNYAFIMAAVGIGIMFLITVFFYKEPKREPTNASVGKKILEIFEVLSDVKFSIFLILLGLFFWLPFWAFFNLGAIYVETHLDSVQLFQNVSHVIGTFMAKLIGRQENGIWMINGEAIAHTGWIIIIFQVIISRIFEKRAAIPSFTLGMFIAALGFAVLGFSYTTAPALVFVGIFLFAVGEMISSPRIQEYITWIAPKEKAGLYMGTNFLATFLGGFLSGFTYTKLLGVFENAGTPHYVWYVLAGHLFLGIVVIFIYIKVAGSFIERTE